MRFLEKIDDLVVCSMVALFRSHMIKKIGQKVGQHKLSLSLNKSLIHESFDRIIYTKKVFFIHF